MIDELGIGDGFKSSEERLDDDIEKRREHASKSIPFRVSFLDDIAVGIAPIDLIVIGAQTGAGKTTSATLIAQNAVKNGTRVHYFCLEGHRNEIERRMLYARMSDMAWDRRMAGRGEISYKRWVHGRCEFLSDAYETEARNKLKSELKNLRTYYRDATFGAKELVKELASIRSETDLVILDHLHFVDNDDNNENRGMKDIVKSLSDCIADIETPVVAIAHLRKKDSRIPRLVPDIDDFHGSSEITKIATVCVLMSPAWDHERPDPHIAPTYMRVAKDRAGGESGYTALLNYNLRTGKYLEHYRLGRLSRMGTEWAEIEWKDRPFWADRLRLSAVPTEVAG